MKKILTLLLLLTSSVSFTQTNLKVYYDFKVHEDLVTMFPEFGNLESEIETLDLRLHIQKDKSCFFNANKTKANEMAAVFARANISLFFDLKSKQFIYNNPERFYLTENEFLIEDNQLVDWEITSESKQIMNYTAVKAISKIDKQIIAWFVPELPFAFGPCKFNNLPGLIVELQNQQGYYTMSKIIFEDKIRINLPDKGKKITAKEFSKLQKEIEEEVKRQFQ